MEADDYVVCNQLMKVRGGHVEHTLVKIKPTLMEIVESTWCFANSTRTKATWACVKRLSRMSVQTMVINVLRPSVSWAIADSPRSLRTVHRGKASQKSSPNERDI
jgi:hypothetical protein